MQKFVLVGTTGLGKTFLELQLEKDYGFYPWPKYTDRSEKRQEEEGQSNIVFLTKEEFDVRLPDFLFTLTYLSNRYGWMRKDLLEHQQQNVTLAIPLDQLVNFMNRVPGFMPIMLNVDPENFSLIERRVKARENYDSLSPEQKKFTEEKIQERLVLASHELKLFPFYSTTVKKYGGKVFTIKDDNTIKDEVIPFILQNRERKQGESFSDIASKYHI